MKSKTKKNNFLHLELNSLSTSHSKCQSCSVHPQSTTTVLSCWALGIQLKVIEKNIFFKQSKIKRKDTSHKSYALVFSSFQKNMNLKIGGINRNFCDFHQRLSWPYAKIPSPSSPSSSASPLLHWKTNVSTTPQAPQTLLNRFTFFVLNLFLRVARYNNTWPKSWSKRRSIWATAFINHILKGRMCFSYSLPRSINF